MRKNWLYLRYVVRHKWFVLQAGIKLGVPLWQLLIHDLSKFRPSEWFPYVASFYGPQPRTEAVKLAFDKAWLLHIHRNPHHWQYWVLREDSGKVKILEMPWNYRLEMLADWAGAAKAQANADRRGWYEKTKEHRLLAPGTLRMVELELEHYLAA